MDHRRRAAVVLLAALAALPLVLGIVGWLQGWPLGMDSVVYRAGASTLLDGDPLYDTPTLPAYEPDWALLPFTYPPAAALLFVPLAPLPIPVAWGAIGVVSILCLALVVSLARRAGSTRLADGSTRLADGSTRLADGSTRLADGSTRLADGSTRLAGTVVLTAAAILLEPVWRTISLGQVNLILLAMVMLDVLVVCARGSRWGGVLLGVASAVKLTPLIFVAHLLFTGRWRDALRAVGTFAGLQAVLLVIAPHDVIRYWTHAVNDPGRIGTIHWSDNQSLNGLLLRLTDHASWSFAAALAVGVLLAGPAVLLMLRFHRRGEPLPALLVTAFYGLLISPVSWTHHWVWCVPLLIVLAARGRWAAVGVLAVVFGSYVLLVLPGGRDPDLGWSLLDHVLGNAYLYVPLAYLMLCSIRPVVRKIADRASVSRPE